MIVPVYKLVKDTAAEYFIFDGDNVLASYDSGGNLNASYLTPGLDANLSMTNSTDRYYYFIDGLGSVRNLVESDEDVANVYDYRAFGVLITETENVDSPFEFTGRAREPGGLSHMHYYRNRYYMPGVGIFTSRDAFRYNKQRAWVYAASRPTDIVDPLGLKDTAVLSKFCKCKVFFDCPPELGGQCIETTQDTPWTPWQSSIKSSFRNACKNLRDFRYLLKNVPASMFAEKNFFAQVATNASDIESRTSAALSRTCDKDKFEIVCDTGAPLTFCWLHPDCEAWSKNNSGPIHLCPLWLEKAQSSSYRTEIMTHEILHYGGFDHDDQLWEDPDQLAKFIPRILAEYPANRPDGTD